MKDINILAISGSLRRDSYNLQLAREAGRMIGDRAGFEILDYADVPFMNEDIEFPTPGPVARVREKVKNADGIWFFTPEYNHYFSAPLKNLIDWLSRPAEPGGRTVISGKPAAISGASPSRAGTSNVQDHLVTLISILNMDVMNVPRLLLASVHEQLGADGKLALTSSAPFLEKQADAFLEFLKKRA